jgi:hypothetical protein
VTEINSIKAKICVKLKNIFLSKKALFNWLLQFICISKGVACLYEKEVGLAPQPNWQSQENSFHCNKN